MEAKSLPKKLPENVGPKKPTWHAQGTCYRPKTKPAKSFTEKRLRQIGQPTAGNGEYRLETQGHEEHIKEVVAERWRAH